MSGPVPRDRSRTWTAAVAAAALVVLVAGCGSGPGADEPVPAPADEPELVLDLDGLTGTPGDGAELPVGGSAQLRAELRSQPEQGAVSVVPGREGGRALELPAYVAGATSDGADGQSLAAVAVRPLSLAPPHPLNPGSQDFVLGASFRLDDLAGGSMIDGGNNLVQRGSFADPAQYKLQVDERQPSCRVVGDEGELLVTSDTKVLPDTWYDVVCTRTEDGLELVVVEHAEDGYRNTLTFTVQGPTGDLSGLDPAVPLSIGSKLTPTGSLVRRETDQFNGAVDDVVLDILG